MKNKTVTNKFNTNSISQQELPELMNTIHSAIASNDNKGIKIKPEKVKEKAEILILSSYPPRECGIATYSQDLISSINSKFSNSFSIKVCALETGDSKYLYPPEVKYSLNTSLPSDYEKMAFHINNDPDIKIVLIQHEFGFFHKQKEAFQLLLTELKKPVVVVFHTVLPHPE